jgi:hypothetical protein
VAVLERSSARKRPARRRWLRHWPLFLGLVLVGGLVWMVVAGNSSQSTPQTASAALLAHDRPLVVADALRIRLPADVTPQRCRARDQSILRCLHSKVAIQRLVPQLAAALKSAGFARPNTRCFSFPPVAGLHPRSCVTTVQDRTWLIGLSVASHLSRHHARVKLDGITVDVIVSPNG